MLKRVCLFVMVLMTLAGLARSADGTFEVPADMQKLMPADAVILAVTTSVNELDRHWRQIEEMLDEESGGGTDILGGIAEYMPQAAAYLDLDRPLALMVGMPDPMSGQEPAVTLILPVNDAFDDEAMQALELDDGAVTLREGDYLALSMDPAFQPAASTPALARDLAPGFMSCRVDLDTLLETLRPLVDMGVASLAARSAAQDSSDTAAPATDHEEIATLQEMMNAIMDSARRFDLAMSVEGEELNLHTGFAVHPGSPLDPGPQPSFEDALQLTRLLPPGGDIIQAMALDQTRQFDVFKPYYLLSLEEGLGEMEATQAEAYRAWLETYLSSLDLFARPLAATVAMSGESMSSNLVMQSPDPAGDLARFSGLFAGLSEADIGLEIRKMPTGKVSGIEVHSWSIDYDAEKLAGFTTDPVNPTMGGTGRMQAEQMIGFLRKVTPNVNMAVRGDYLILSADTDPSRLAHMIQAAGQSRGAARPEIAAVAPEAGPTCQQVVTGDMMAIIAWVTEWMEELDDQEFDTVQDHPIPFTSAFTLADGEYGLNWTMDMPSVKRFIVAVQELEALDDARKETEAPESPDGE
jgi:hypothetical protein